MKIRNGFVSNSSSSSYVVFIPDNFSVDCKKFAEDYDYDELDVDVLEDMVTELKNGSGLYSQDNYSEYEAIVDVLREKDLIVLAIDGGPDDGSVETISQKKITEIYNKYVGGQR